jgi:hypothetical protein
MLPRNAEYLFFAYGFAALAITIYGLWVYLKLRAVVKKTARLSPLEDHVS